jgi:negative regulator of sigma-B (phosphoserine phosphatase)
MTSGASAVLEWAVASRPLPGEHVSGDAAVVSPAGDRAVVAAVDALGHGPEAARVAARAASVVEEFAAEDVASIVRRCHEALRGTRGAAISAASFSAADGTMTWLGVGNVEGRLVRSRRADEAPLGAGVAGAELPLLAPVTLPVARGDVLAFATDGIDGGFADWLDVSGTPQRIADRILADHGKPVDDALVVVARYLGRTP